MNAARFAALAICPMLALGLGTTRVETIDTALFADSGDDPRSLAFDRIINAPPELVWRQIATPAGVRSWLDVDSGINLAIGGAYELYFEEGRSPGNRGTEGTQILSYVPNRMLSLSWNAPTSLNQVRGQRTWVTFLIEPTANGSRVQIVHAGFGDSPGWNKAYAYYESGWPTVLGMLKRSLEGVAD